MSAPWPSDYLRIPFVDRGLDRTGCDCYGLVRLILAERCGISLPMHHEIEPGAMLAKVRTIAAAVNPGGTWEEIPAGGEREFDAVLMRAQFEAEGRAHSRPIHIGVVVSPGSLIHTEDGAGVTVVDYRAHPRIRNRVQSFWRPRLAA